MKLKDWEIIADQIVKPGWSHGNCPAVLAAIVDASKNGVRFLVHALMRIAVYTELQSRRAKWIGIPPSILLTIVPCRTLREAESSS